MFAIFFFFFPILGAWDKQLPITFSEAQVANNKQISAIVNFDPSALTWISCASGGGFMGGYVFATIFPLAVLATMAIVYIIMKAVWGKKDNGLNKLRKLKDNLLSTIITLLLVVYPAVSRKCFAFFECDEDFFDGRPFLVSDYQIECYKGQHAAMTPYALVMICIYPIGLPLVLLIILVRANSKNFLYEIDTSGRCPVVDRIGPDFPLPTEKGASMMGELYIGYEDEVYYYEVIDMIRRLMLTAGFKLLINFTDNEGTKKLLSIRIYKIIALTFLFIFLIIFLINKLPIPVFIDQLMLFLILIILVCISIQGILQPYIQFSTDLLAMLLNICLFVIIFGALMMNSLDVPNVNAHKTIVNKYNENIIMWQTFIHVMQTIGYIVGGVFLIYESYFGKMFSELILVNDRLPNTEQITKREWFPIYNQKLKDKLAATRAAMENKVENKIHTKNNKNKNKVVPSPNESMDEDNALKNWGRSD